MSPGCHILGVASGHYSCFVLKFGSSFMDMLFLKVLFIDFETEREKEAERERGRERIPSQIHTVSAECDQLVRS